MLGCSWKEAETLTLASLEQGLQEPLDGAHRLAAKERQPEKVSLQVTEMAVIYSHLYRLQREMGREGERQLYVEET
jgi:hypothetical protein